MIKDSETLTRELSHYEVQNFSREREIFFLQSEVAKLKNKLNEVLQKLEESEIRAEQHLNNYVLTQHKINQIINSNSWRLTLPFRFFKKPIKYLKKSI